MRDGGTLTSKLGVGVPIALNRAETIADPVHSSCRAYARIGSAYAKQENFELAIKNFNKSLTEHRTPDVLAKLKEAETTKAEKERLAYIDPAKADEAREEGNKAFKASFGRRSAEAAKLIMQFNSRVTLLDPSRTTPSRSSATLRMHEATPTEQPL